MITRTLAVTTLLVSLFLTSAPSLAQDDGVPPRFGYQWSEFLQGKEKPYLILTSTLPLDKMQIVITRDDGKEFKFKKKNVKANKEVKVTWKQSSGRHGYTYVVHSVDNVGLSATSDPVDFTITKMGKLEVKLDHDDVDLEAGHLKLSATNPVVEVRIKVYNKTQKVISERVQEDEKGLTGEILVEWDNVAAPKDEIAFLDVRVTDAGTFWWETRLIPFYYGLEPKENPEFDTNSADLKASEEVKLHEPLKLIKEQLEICEPYGCLDSAKLYIGGYTDSVGSAESNRTLSSKRARTIARYFRAQGIKLPIYYQGFGEDVLIVQTADEVDEVRNRRAYYVLTNARPSSPQFPSQNWKRLK